VKRYMPLLLIPVLMLAIIGATTYRSYRVGVQNIRYGGTPKTQTMISGTTRTVAGLTPVNALAFGVDNTGVTDCSDSLLALIDSVEAWGGGTIYLPYGKYLVATDIFASVAFADTIGVNIVGDGPMATRLYAGDDDVNVFHWSTSYGSISGLSINGNGYTGVTGLRLSPQNEAQTTTRVHQDYNNFRDIIIEDCAEGIVLQCGPYVGGSVSGCYFNTFSGIAINRCTRGIWFKDGPNTLASGSNRNQFFGVRVGLSMNTGVQIDAGGTNAFYGLSIEEVATGTSPNTIPTAIKILASAPVGTRGNGNNMFYGLMIEGCTRDLDSESTTAEFYGHSMVGTKINMAGAATIPNVFLSAQAGTVPVGFKWQTYNQAKNDSLFGSTPIMIVDGGDAPTVTGVHAPIGSLLLHTSGIPYYKTSTDSTGWRRVTDSVYGAAAANDTTPSVSGLRFLALPANAGVTVIDQLDDSVPYQIVTLICTSNTNPATISNAGNFVLYTAWTPSSGETLTLMTTGSTTWYEVCRSETPSWSGNSALPDTSWDDVVVPAAGISLPAASAPDTKTWLSNLKVIAFAAAGGEYGYFPIQIPHGYLAGANIEWHVHFTTPDTIANGETIIWKTTYTKAPIYGKFGSTGTVSSTFTNNSATRSAISAIDASCVSGTKIVPNAHLMSTSVAISGTGLTMSAIIYMRLERDSSDTHDAKDTYFISADAHVPINRLGSSSATGG
jgi:hypothetical protein